MYTNTKKLAKNGLLLFNISMYKLLKSKGLLIKKKKNNGLLDPKRMHSIGALISYNFEQNFSLDDHKLLTYKHSNTQD